MNKNICILQGGGPTAVINQTLAALIKEAGQFTSIKNIHGLRHTLDGSPSSDAFELLNWCNDINNFQLIESTPGAFLGSSRNRTTDTSIKKALKTLQKLNINVLVGIGGNGTMQTLKMIKNKMENLNYNLQIVGISKTVDNDLEGTFVSPGYPSAAQFVANTTQELGYDFQSMSTFDEVLIFETMGRNTGWLSAASVAHKNNEFDPPHLIYTPEMKFSLERIISDVKETHEKFGRVFIVCSEVLTDEFGESYCTINQDEIKVDSLGRPMYSLTSGTAMLLAKEINEKLNLNARTVRPGVIGRCSMAHTPKQDQHIAEQVATHAVKLILNEKSEVMIGVDKHLKPLELHMNKVAEIEKKLPPEYIQSTPPYINVTKFQSDYLGKVILLRSNQTPMPYTD
ncbi:diphosphate--fructose-6-phosphate 1-phosphotransferase [Vibrio tasmaniensis]|uniref:diphosphate--fructose-6-phosphate 1-phosphotransferase n=1 Tax=Vibrio tasmaniensis TaxID=212663 RepID=UPI00107EF7C6|nr:diphosphate--fructose-6-phosphate 1-phosphotransferase [Vibrio tasmaniensis]